MTDSELVDEVCEIEKWGTRLKDDALFPLTTFQFKKYLIRGRAWAASAVEKLESTSPIHVDFIHDPLFNAFAFRYKSRYFVLLHDSVPVIMTLVINRMLADSRLFLDVGNPKAERIDTPILQSFGVDASRLGPTTAPLVRPLDPHRQTYADWLCDLTFDFIMTHEVTHLVHGHVDYSEDEYGMPYISESRWMADTPAGNVESQAMELDADFNAAYPILMTMRRIVSDPDKLPEPLRSRYKTPANAIFDLGVAVCIVFRLFDDDMVTGVSPQDGTHPPSRFRQRMILNAIANYAEQNWNSEFFPVAEEAFSRAVEEVERGYEFATGSERRVEGLNDAFSPAGIEYAKRLTDCWNNTLVPKLSKYAREKLNTYNFAP